MVKDIEIITLIPPKERTEDQKKKLRNMKSKHKKLEKDFQHLDTLLKQKPKTAAEKKAAYRQKQTAETREKVRAADRARKATEEVRAADRTRKATEEARAANRAGMAAHRAGLDDETMEEVRAADRTRKATEEARATNRAGMAAHRAGLDDETMEEVRAADRARKATEEARAANRAGMAAHRARMDDETMEEVRAANRAGMAAHRAGLDDETMEEVRAADRARKTNKRNKRSVQPRDGLRAKEVMTGTLIVPYIGDTEDGIGKMNVECPYCKALKFKNETPSMCCNNGKIQLQPFPKPPPQILKLFRPDLFVDGDEAMSKVFLKYIRPLNNALCLSSLRANYQIFKNYNPTVIIQGQVHQYAGPLQAREGETPVFAQIYVQDPSLEMTTRFANLTVPASITAQEKSKLRTLLQKLQDTLRESNPFVRDFCQIISIPDDQLSNCQLVISAKARPQGEHERRYNPQVFISPISLLNCQLMFRCVLRRSVC